MEKVSVLFVCMGNICRSPTAHGVFADMVNARGLNEKIIIDSAGTHAYHIGEPPDQRASAAARERGINLSSLRARQVVRGDFNQFDYVLAMDQSNLRGLSRLASNNQPAQIRLFMDFAQRWDDREVPDPYYGGNQGFERVLDMVEDASDGLLRYLVKHHL